MSLSENYVWSEKSLNSRIEYKRQDWKHPLKGDPVGAHF